MAQPICGWFLTALVVVMPVTNQMEKRPDFSGTWVGVSSGDEGFQQTVKQAGTTLEVRIGSEGRRFVYLLDGSESRNQFEVDGARIVTVSRANWKSEQLIITSSMTYPDGSKSEMVDTWSLDPKGQLVIEGTEKMTRADGKPDGTGTLHLVLRRK